jgi:hypothetical protein
MKHSKCGVKTIFDTREVIITFLTQNLDNYLSTENNETTPVKAVPFLKIGEIKDQNFNFQLLNLELGAINFSTRFKNVLKNFPDLKSLRDLLKKETEEFLSIKNCGRKTITECQFLISNILDKKNTRVSLEQNGLIIKGYMNSIDEKKGVHDDMENINIIALLNSFITNLDKKKFHLINLLWSNASGNSTLQNVADRLHLTRERVRQIRNSIIRSFVREYVGVRYNDFLKQLYNILLKTPKPIDLSSLIAPNECSNYPGRLYIRFLTGVFKQRIFYGIIKKTSGYLSQPQRGRRPTKKKKTLKYIYSTLQKLDLITNKITPAYLIDKVFETFATFEEKLEIFSLIFSLKNYEFKQENGAYYLIKKNLTLPDYIKTVLNDSSMPLSVDNILKKIVNEQGVKDFNSRSVFNAAKRTDGIYQFGRHEFGLKRHFSYVKENWKPICDDAKKILQRYNRQVYVSELLKELRTKYQKIRSKYELVYILRTDLEIIDLGFFHFSLLAKGINTRKKVIESIRRIYNEDPCVKYLYSILNKLNEERYCRSEGLLSILKQIDFLEHYKRGFFGLKGRRVQNLQELAKNEKFINNLISYVYFPSTSKNNVLQYFNTNELKDIAENTIMSSQSIFTFEKYGSSNSFLISINWGILKKIKCILYNWAEPMRFEELKWVLTDICNDYSKIKDESIKSKMAYIHDIEFKDNRYFYNDSIEHNYEEISELQNDIYEYLSNINKVIPLKELYDMNVKVLKEMKINMRFLREVLLEDDRLLVTQEVVGVKS